MLGDKLKELRIKKGLTQQKLADATNISRSAIAMVEKNKQGLGRENLIVIANFFGVTVDYLLSDDIKVDINSTSNKLGDKIKALRKERRITQQELANAIEVVQSTIGMIESGKKTGSPQTLVKLADFFGVTVDYLLSENDEEVKEVKKERDYSLTIKEQENIDVEAQKILDELSMSFSKNKEMLTEEDYFAIENALKITLESIKIKNKKKFTPKKYK